MKRALPYLALGLFLGLGVGFLVRLGSGGTQRYFCDAALEPASYSGEWFYRLLPAPGGWLLRADDLETRFVLDRKTLAYLKTLDRVLKGRGVTLIIAAQPPRGVALAAESLADYTPGEATARYEAVRNTLQNAGLYVTDLASVARDTPNYFFRRDHHWTPDGSRASAEAVAQTLEATPTFRSVVAKQKFKTEAVRTEEQVGSFGEAVGRICGKNPPAEKLTRYRTEPVEASPNGKLFGTSAPPIVLAGTSNSARKDLNFAGFLAQASGLEVLNVAAVGGGPQAALEAYLRSRTFREAKPVFLVWEFATLFDLPQDLLFYRQLVPSVRSACRAAKSKASVTKQLSRTVPLFKDLRGEDEGFLYLELSDLSQTSFGLKLNYLGGQTETVRLERSRREHNDGKFFFSFDKPLVSATLTLPEGADGNVQARLCP